jgi:hypothetical protein
VNIAKFESMDRMAQVTWIKHEAGSEDLIDLLADFQRREMRQDPLDTDTIMEWVVDGLRGLKEMDRDLLEIQALEYCHDIGNGGDDRRPRRGE